MIEEETSSRATKAVPREKAFYFFTSIGNYTGESAASLKEFSQKINEVNVKSLEFHLVRGDFERWINDVLQDEWLAMEVRRLQRYNLNGDSLRNQLSATVSKRLRQLAGTT